MKKTTSKFHFKMKLLAASFILSLSAMQGQIWSNMIPLLNNQLNSSAATGADGLLYVVGGGAYANPTPRMEKFNPINGSAWIAATDMSIPREGLTFIFGTDGYLYAIGGTGHLVQFPGRHVERYSTVTNTWASMADLPQACTTAAVGPDNKLYAIGGSNPNFSMYSFNTPTAAKPKGEWIVKPAPSFSGDINLALTGLDGNIYLFSQDGECVKFDGTQWIDLALGVGFGGAVIGPNGKFYVISGNGGVIYDPISANTTPIQNLIFNHTPPMAITTAEGYIFINTGSHSTGSSTWRNLEKYGPLKAPDFAPNCKALWRFNEANGPTVVDSKGVNTGSVIGSAVHATAGRVGKSLIFNGTTQYVKVNNSPTINFGASSMTIEGWIKWVPVNGVGVVPILDKRTQTGNNFQGYHLFITSAGKLGFQMANGTTYQNYVSVQNTILANQWTHIAVSVDRTSTSPTVSLYINSVLDKTFTPLQGNITNTAALNIGRHSLDSSSFKGEMDEVALYNRSLRWAEIRAIFLAGKEGKQ